MDEELVNPYLGPHSVSAESVWNQIILTLAVSLAVLLRKKTE